MDKNKVIADIKVCADGQVLNDWMNTLSIVKTPDVNYFYGNLIRLNKRNANADMVPEDEAVKALPTMRFKMVGVSEDPFWRPHYGNIVGGIIDARIIESSTEEESDGIAEKYVQVLGVIYTDKANEVYGGEYLRDILQGTHRMSMETYFTECECSECGSRFNVKDVYCDHLQNRSNWLSESDSIPVARILRGLTFSGGVFTVNPAERKAAVLAIAEDSKKGNDEKVEKNETPVATPASADSSDKVNKIYEQSLDEYKKRVEEQNTALKKMSETLAEMQKKEEIETKKKERINAVREKVASNDLFNEASKIIDATVELTDDKFNKVIDHFITAKSSAGTAAGQPTAPAKNTDPITVVQSKVENGDSKSLLKKAIRTVFEQSKKK